MVRSSKKIAVVLSCSVLSGCLGTLQPAERVRSDALGSRCGSPAVRLAALPEARSVRFVQGETAGLERFSAAARETAATINIVHLLKGIPSSDAKAAVRREDIPHLLWLRQHISRRIGLASSDIVSTIAEIDCEEARADHVADGLMESRQETAERALFLVFAGDVWIGIIAGALVIAGHETIAAANEVFGGVFATGFGAAEEFLGGEHEFRHSRNHLRELWEGPEQSALFPASVWRYLNGPSETLPGRTVREALLERWRQEGRFGEPGAETERKRIALLFEDGGVYGIKELRLRAEMLAHLKSEIFRMGQDLNRLLYEVVAWWDPMHELIGRYGSSIGLRHGSEETLDQASINRPRSF